MKTMVMYTRRISCQDCEAVGCHTCRNVGVLHQDVILEVNITADVMDKDGNLVYSTYGDLIKGLPMGNLIIKPIYRKGEEFTIQLSDNDYPVVISECNVFEGDGGKKIRVDTLHGKVELTLPDKIKNNQVIRIKGKGLQFRYKEGDHHIILKFI
jgi:molecular chaperone DnaJ